MKQSFGRGCTFLPFYIAVLFLSMATVANYNYKCIFLKFKYCKSGNFHVKIIHGLNIHINLFLWVYGTHKNILTGTYFMNIYYYYTIDFKHEY